MFLLKKFLKKIEIINKKNKIHFYENDSNFIFVTKLFFLLSNNDRKLFILIIISSILGAVAEFASIGMVIPALKVVFSDSNYLFKFLQIDSSNIANQKYLSLLIISSIFPPSFLKEEIVVLIPPVILIGLIVKTFLHFLAR